MTNADQCPKKIDAKSFLFQMDPIHSKKIENFYIFKAGNEVFQISERSRDIVKNFKIAWGSRPRQDTMSEGEAWIDFRIKFLKLDNFRCQYAIYHIVQHNKKMVKSGIDKDKELSEEEKAKIFSLSVLPPGHPLLK